MNTLQERLGVAVEADAARFSGEKFADAWGGNVTGRVKRRRQVRATAYGGGTMLAAGALVLGGTKLPWGTLAGPAVLGGGDCAPVSASPNAPAADGERYAFAETKTLLGDVIEFEVPGSSSQDSPLYVLTMTTMDGVTVTTQDGTTAELAFDDQGVVTFVGGDGRILTLMIGPDRDLVTFTVSLSGNELQDRLQPSSSPDCVTPSPVVSASASPVPSPSTVLPESVASPFQCGFEFDSEVYGTDYISVNEPEWLTADAAWERVTAMYADPEFMTESRPVADVVLVTTSGSAADTIVSMGQSGYLDPADPAGGLMDTTEEYFSQGLTFVEAYDGVVTARYDHRELSGPPSPVVINNVFNSSQLEAFLLDEERALIACTDADTSGERALYAVAGLGKVLSDGTVEGPFYAWRYIDRP